MVFETKINLTFDRKHLGTDADVQFYRVYRKKNQIPDRASNELIMTIAQPFFPENIADTITRLDSQLPQTGVTYDPLEQINLVDPRGAPYKIAIDASVPIPPTNLVVIPDPTNGTSDIGGLLLQWTPAVSTGTIWGYDVTAVDAGGLESPEGASLAVTETSKLETINIGLADGSTPAPSEYPLAGQIFNTYLVEGGSQNFLLNNQASILDDNHSNGWDTTGPNGVSGHSALSDFPTAAITLRWTETLKNIGTDQSSRRFKVTAFTKAGYSNSSVEIPGPSSVICPITNGRGGVTITRLDVTRWHNGTSLKTAPPPPPELLSVPNILDAVVAIKHGSIIRGTATITDTSGTTIYIEDSGTFNFPNHDGDYIIDYSMINGFGDFGSRVKILNSGIIQPGQTLFLKYKFGLDFGNGIHSAKPTMSDPIVGPYNGTIWSGAGPQNFIDTLVEPDSAYNYAWFVTDNAGRTTHNTNIKYAQGILQDVTFPTAVENFKIEAVLLP